jgi:hypothetical protein
MTAASAPPIGDLPAAESLAYTAAIMGEIDKIAASTGSSKESVAQAFLHVRPEVETDQQALDMLREIAKRNPAPIHPPNSITLHGGEGPRLPTEDETLNGTPNPALADQIAVGKTRYHLDTLTQLEAESHLPPDEDADSCPSSPTPESRKRQLGAAASMLTIAACGGLLPVGVDRRKALDEARAKARRPLQQGPQFKVKDARAGCGSAGCRALDKCLCTCRQCREACLARKTP